ncbi:YIP1 family protein [Bacillus sp. JJ722]|uniref:YIP1 family protein n=1 Tax=Bacillus sp. JJ722 TaxID=3122973 RepID=UPI002FFEBD88
MKKIISFIALAFMLMTGTYQASASAPYVTETLSPQNELIVTQTAYNPVGLFANEYQFEKIEDIFLDEHGSMYVVDSALQKVIKFNSRGEVLAEIGTGLFKKPLGVFVSETNDIYVADQDLKEVVKFDQNGKVVSRYGTPDSPLFGKKMGFKPQKVSVDKRGNLYVISEGSANGIVQLNAEGEFLGFYGSNSTEQSFIGNMQKMLFPNSIKDKSIEKLPPAPTNIVIDDTGLVYSITKGTTNESIKKLNVAGTNMLGTEMIGKQNLEDITVDAFGNISIVGNDGIVSVYDSYGRLLFQFGGKDDGTNRLGLFQQPSTIAVDEQNRLYVGDRENGTITIFEITNFGEKVLGGVAGLKEGLYIESQKYWEEVLQLNDSFALAHTAMGKAYFQQNQYSGALKEYQLASDREGYSNAFWQIRHEWMLNHLDVVLYVFLGFVAVVLLIRFLDRKKQILKPVRYVFRKIKNIRLVSELLFMFYFLKNPIDAFYELKRNNRVSILSATILYFVFYLEILFSMLGSGYIFTSNVEDFNLGLTTVYIIGSLTLFIVMNYLVSTINNGEGKFTQVYKGVIYSLTPFIILSFPITIISNFLTYNEAFVYEFTLQIAAAWCGVILFIMIKELHNYTISETVRNILVTIFAMILTVLVVLLLFVLTKQVFDFVYSIVQEVIIRV